MPESGDFGPCFTRTAKKVRRFELGFEPASPVGDVKTIHGLQAGGGRVRVWQWQRAPGVTDSNCRL